MPADDEFEYNLGLCQGRVDTANHLEPQPSPNYHTSFNKLKKILWLYLGRTRE